MSKRKISLVSIAIALCCALVLVPVICSVLYFGTSVAHRLEGNARETASFYIDQIATKASGTLDTLRGSIYYLMSDQSTQKLMRNPEEATQSERLAVEEGLNRAFFLGNQLDQSTVTGIYMVKDNLQYLSVLRGGIYLGTSTRVTHVYQTFQDVNSARDLYVDPSYPDYCYLIVDYIDLDSMISLGKIIIELKLEGLIDATYLTNMYHQSVVMLRASDGRILSSDLDAFAKAASAQNDYVEVEGEHYYHTSRQLSPSRVLIDVFILKSEIFETSNDAIKIYIFFAFIVLLLTLSIGSVAAYRLYKPLRQMMRNIDGLAAGDLTVRMDATLTAKPSRCLPRSTTWPTIWKHCSLRSMSRAFCCGMRNSVCSNRRSGRTLSLTFSS